MFDIKKIVKQSIIDGVPYKPGKPIDELERELGISNIDKLASNENACGTPEGAKKAIIDAVDKLYLYPDGESYDFKQAIANHHGIEYDHIFTGNGTDELLQIIMNTFLNPGDNVVSSERSFMRYGQMTKIANGVYRQAPMTSGMRYDLEAILTMIDSRTKIVPIGNPNNPTGTIVYRDEVKRFLDRMPDHVVVIFDEAYAGFVESTEYPDSIALQREFAGKPIVTLRSFSKIFGLAGARVGYGIAHSDIVKYINIVRGPFNISMLAQAAGIACFSCGEHSQKSKDVCSAEKKYLYEQYDKLGLEYIKSEANFILIRVDDIFDGKLVCEKLLRSGIIVRPMAAWGLSDNFMRVTIGTHEQNVRFVNEMSKILSQPEKIKKMMSADMDGMI